VNTNVLRALLVAGMLSGSVALVRVAAWPIVQVELPPAPEAAPGAPRDPAPRLAADSLAGLVARDPFRVARRPAPTVYDPLRLAEQLAPAPPKPVLTVVGVVSGPEPAAVIEGLPGMEGSRVVRVGDVVGGGLRVKQIDRDRVVIVGMDTTWVLKVREPWRDGR
jgi:hypothetical protein